jgi:hypothetical protein
MLQVRNLSRFPATLAVFPDPRGVECAFAAVKATFDLSHGVPLPAERQAAFLAADVYWADPAQSALRAAADLTLLKPATDILLDGRALAAKPVRSMDVVIEVGPLRRTLRVFGDRHWTRNDKTWAISAPQPFERMPLRWELAFGGRAAAGDAEPEVDWRNPVGRGLVAEGEDELEGRALPNIEDPGALILSPADRPLPAGCGPIPPVWLPRRGFAGTYDEAWQKQRAPHLPLDFDSAFFNVAPPGLVAPGYLQGGEAVSISGCTLGAPLAFELPRPGIALEWHFDGKAIAALPLLDTVLIEPDKARLQMVWRAQLAVDKKLLRLTEVVVACAEHPRLEAAA